MNRENELLKSTVSMRVVTVEDYILDRILFIALKDGSVVVIDNDRGLCDSAFFETQTDVASYYGTEWNKHTKVSKKLEDVLKKVYLDYEAGYIGSL